MRTPIAFLIAALIMATPTLAGHLAVPHLHATAVHLGGGFIQYTVDISNPLGGPVAADVAAQGNFNQIDADVPVVEGGTGMLDPVDEFTLAQAADVHDANYLAAGGSVFDSWWDMNASHFGPPLPGRPDGGEVGSMLYQATPRSAAGTNIFQIRLAQFVIFDAAAAGLPPGPQTVVDSGLAPLDIVNFFGSPSLVAAGGMNTDVNGAFAVIPEPSTITLAGFGLIGLLAYGRRRRRA